MGRLITLIVVCTLGVGALMTFGIPLDWIGHLPGDISFDWHGRHVFAPFGTSVVLSLVLSALFSLFLR
ncbi:MAG: DUF2905 domain-containing protein [Simkaniaceae bacterium]|nr:DUF2905 domain-containing protein [Simkaniaceae bacterium]